MQNHIKATLTNQTSTKLSLALTTMKNIVFANAKGRIYSLYQQKQITTNKEDLFMNETNNALQVMNFDFYGDSLIALKDNATGEIYTSITQVLRNIGFTEKQNEYQKKKFMHDTIVSKGIQKFSGVDLGMPSINEVVCISNRKLPIALTKITITPKMKKEQPDMSKKLIKYQDKCADVLASVFIDHNSTDNINLQPLLDAITTLTQSMTAMQQDIVTLKEQQMSIQKRLPKKRFSSWTSKMFPKYQLLMDYFQVERKELYHNLYIELQNMYPDIDLNQEQDDYCFDNGLDGCFTLDAIEHNKTLRQLFSQMVDNLLEKYNIAPITDIPLKQRTIFDD